MITIISINKVEIPYLGTPQIINNGPIILNDNDSLRNYLKNQIYEIHKSINDSIYSSFPSQDQHLKGKIKINGTEKYINFDFRLSFYSQIILYLIALITIYPISLLSLGYLWKFISRGEPFTK